MDKTTVNSYNQSTLLRVTDIILLVVCGIIIAGRCHINEAFGTDWRLSGAELQIDVGHAEVTTMLIFAGLIWTMALSWLLVRVLGGGFFWKRTCLVIPLLILSLAAILSTWFASNKNTALIGAVNLISQVILAILLVQLLDAPWKRRLLLAVIAATGVTMAYRCWEQYKYDLPDLVQMYEQNPQSLLRQHGFEPGTYEAEQFTQRLKSRDVGGYFFISNTAAAFFILSLGATLALLSSRWNNYLNRRQWHYPAGGAALLLAQILLLVLVLAQIAGLFITRSKGGIGGWLVALGLLVGLGAGRNFLSRHWKASLTTATALVTLVVIALASYGIHYGRLPTNSMWVRWQYWQAGAAMIADHGLTGVGAENFGRYYPRYMDPAAPEVVKDPHCFPIAILSQWGITGLVAVIWASLAVSIRLVRPQQNAPSINQTNQVNKEPSKLWPWGMVIVPGIVFIQGAVSDLSGPLSAAEVRSVILLSFIMPTAVWVGAFGLALWAGGMGEKPAEANDKNRGAAALVLGCALLGFMLHNSIDFAVFQPGVGTLFFATAGLALSLPRQRSDNLPRRLVSNRLIRGLISPVVIVMTLGYWIFIFKPIATSQNYLNLARQSSSIEKAQNLSARADAANQLDPDPHYFLAQIYQQRWYQSGQKDHTVFVRAIDSLKAAIRRDPAHYRYYHKMSELYQEAAQLNQADAKKLYAQKAEQYLGMALQRHPAKSELLIDYGKLLMEYGELLEIESWPEQALNALEKALAYEQAFQAQQRQMYPEMMEQRSRLQPIIQEEARRLIKQLQKQ